MCVWVGVSVDECVRESEMCNLHLLFYKVKVHFTVTGTEKYYTHTHLVP